MRCNLKALVLWHAARGLLPFDFAQRLWRSGRRFRIDRTLADEIAFYLLVGDEYRMIQRKLEPSDVVVDVGALIGLFGLAAHASGSRSILSYEAQSESFSKLELNYAHLPGAAAFHAAVFRSDDERPEELGHNGTGARGSVMFEPNAPMCWWDGGMQPAERTNAQRVSTIALDDILSRHRRVRLLKVDAEGSEFPILLTSKLLDRVDEIVGECHSIDSAVYRNLHPGAQIAGRNQYSGSDLTAKLESEGFTVELKGQDSTLQLFYAVRPEVSR